MAHVRMTLDEARAKARVDRETLDATSEADIARFNAEDGFDPNDTLKGLRRVHTPADVRARAGLTQAEMAARLTVPLKTWRNWEQGRTALDPAVRALLALVAADPERAFHVLDDGFHAPAPPVPEDAIEGHRTVHGVARDLRQESDHATKNAANAVEDRERTA